MMPEFMITVGNWNKTKIEGALKFCLILFYYNGWNEKDLIPNCAKDRAGRAWVAAGPSKVLKVQVKKKILVLHCPGILLAKSID